MIHKVYSPKAKITACGLKITERVEVATIDAFDVVEAYERSLDVDRRSWPDLDRFLPCAACKNAKPHLQR